MKSRDNFGILETGDVERFDALLGSLLTATDARSVLLVDRTGRLLASAGAAHAFDRTAFASLAAADFAASSQLAGLLGEPEFASLYHHGDQSAMYMADVDGRAILAVLFDGATTLGMVRLRLRAVVPDLAQVFRDMAGRTGARAAALDGNWAAEAEDQIDRLFSDQLPE
jgi:predicted regulator of Ras-like GTPase activity (Roadblock/LC7/MglB family)